MKNKYYKECEACNGTGNENEETLCECCEGKGFTVTSEGYELIEFLEKIGVL